MNMQAQLLFGKLMSVVYNCDDVLLVDIVGSVWEVLFYC